MKYPKSMGQETSAALFGVVTTADAATGRPKVWEFAESGGVSKLWLNEGWKTGAFPRLVQSDREYFVFADSTVIRRRIARARFRRLAA